MPRNTDTSHLSRRAFISKTLLGSAGIICGASSQSQAFLGFSHAGQTLPEQWVAQQSNDTLKYANYINKKVELSRVSIPNFIESHFKSRRSVSNNIPPAHMWKNIVDNLAVTDKLAQQLNCTPFIVSAYRAPDYNRTCFGASSKSYHLQNQALDVKFPGHSTWKVASYAKKLRTDGWFKGGIGIYSTFVHIDTRGYDANWVKR